MGFFKIIILSLVLVILRSQTFVFYIFCILTPLVDLKNPINTNLHPQHPKAKINSFTQLSRNIPAMK